LIHQANDWQALQTEKGKLCESGGRKAMDLNRCHARRERPSETPPGGAIREGSGGTIARLPVEVGGQRSVSTRRIHWLKSGPLVHHKYVQLGEEIREEYSIMSKLMKRSHKGFTLVEIMIVVLIIGILLAIAVPNFIRARESSRAKSCVANLKQIESAKEQWAMDTKATPTATPLTTDLYGATKYVKTTPNCPSGGTYTIDTMANRPSCSITNNGTATDASDDHILP
jgi:prepilin-type N-terminal cleavage/methylation domain-containing protein